MSIFAAVIRAAAIACLALGASVASAQILDDIDIRREGDNAVARIRFVPTIQYQRHVVTPSGDVVIVYFIVTSREDARPTVDETLRSPPTDLMPGFTVTYSATQQTTPRNVEIRFREPVQVRVRPGEDHSILLVVPAKPVAEAAPPVPAPAPVPPTPVRPATPVDEEASALIAAARQAIGRSDFETAVASLNKLLNLPPNAFSQEAQELIGVAREGAGEPVKARAEYELYLRLYPTGDGADRVRQRLASLKEVPPEVARARAIARAPMVSQYWGSLSQYYYGGKARTKTETTIITPATNATVIDTQTLSATDQSSLVTNLDASARFRSSEWDNRLVFRNSNTLSFLDSDDSENRLYALYAEAKNQPTQTLLRAGRQSVNTGGVLGRFDGAYTSWGFAPKWRANAVVGTPAELLPGKSKTFFGMSLDTEGFMDRIGANLYAIGQRTEGLTDRFAVGTELRYFDVLRSLFAVVDYDVEFRLLNIGSVQGTWQIQGGPTFNLLYDYRRTPSMALSNALLGESTDSLKTLLETRTRDEVEAQAKALTPVSRVFLIGATYPVTRKWQIGGDFRLSSISGTGETPTLPAAPGTGWVKTYTVQGIGTGLWGTRDVVVLNASYLTGDAYDAWLAAVTPRLVVRDAWTVEPILRWYKQNDVSGTRLTRWTPSLKVSYRLRERFMLEAEYDVERSHSVSSLVDDTSTHHFFYVGYRWDF